MHRGYPAAAGAGFHDEQAVQAPEPHCAVHSLEAGGEHRRGLRVQELAPSWRLLRRPDARRW